MTYEVQIDGRTHRVELRREGERWLCRVDGRDIKADVVDAERDLLSLDIGGHSYEVMRLISPTETRVVVNGASHIAEVFDPRSFRGKGRRRGQDDGPQKITAPMPGKVVRVLHQPGDAVEAGQGVVVIEA